MFFLNRYRIISTAYPHGEYKHADAVWREEVDSREHQSSKVPEDTQSLWISEIRNI